MVKKVKLSHLSSKGKILAFLNKFFFIKVSTPSTAQLLGFKTYLGCENIEWKVIAIKFSTVYQRCKK
jgi:hypothetical protein